MKTTSCLFQNCSAFVSSSNSDGRESARADTYSWTNFQSDIAGVAQHIDSNLVNPWGMSVSAPNGTIWVSDNGTGVSTLYGQDGTARSLVVTIPTAARNRGGGNPTGVKSATTPVLPSDKEWKFGACPVSFLSVKTVPSQVGTPTWIRRTPLSPSITARIVAVTAPFTKAQRSA